MKNIIIENQELKNQFDFLGVFGLIIVCLSLVMRILSNFLYDFYFMYKAIYFIIASIPFTMSFFVKRKPIKIILMILGIINIIFQSLYFF